MILYILKFTGCLLVLYLFYRLVLENEKNHRFKRFYLLFTLFAAMTIPLVTITYHVEAPISQATILMPDTMTNVEEVNTTSWKEVLPVLLWAIYALGFSVFLIRFLKNLWYLKNLIRTYENVRESLSVKVLLPFQQIPYSYFRYIFVERQAFENKTIPYEILKHEEAHVQQKHTLDLLVLEILQIVFWFNPLFVFIKKSIRLNHEFLADEAVLNQNISALSYSKLLLHSSFGSHQAPMTSSFKHSLIKKRIVMISNSFSKKRVGLKMGFLVPVVCCCIYFFNNNIVAETIQQEPPIVTEILEAFTMKIHGEQIELNGEKIRLNEFVSKLDKITDQYSDEDLLKNNIRLELTNVSEDFKKKVEKEFLKTHYYKVMKQHAKKVTLFPALPAPPPPPMQFKNKEKKPVAPPVPPKAPNKDSIVEVIEVVEDVPEPPKPMIIEVVEDIPEPSKVEEIIAVEAIDIQNPQRPTHQIYINNEKSIKELIKDYNDQLKKVNALLPEGYPMAYLNLKEEEQDEINNNIGKLYKIHLALSKRGAQDKVSLMPPPPPARNDNKR